MIVKEKRMSLGSEALGKIRRVYQSKKKQVYRLSKDVQDVALEGFAFKTRTLKSLKSLASAKHYRFDNHHRQDLHG